MPSNLRGLVSSWLDLRRMASISSINDIRVLHPCKSDNALLKTIFRGKLVYYSTAYIGQVRYTTSNQARDKVIDDSNIIFKTSTEENFGRIRHIFTVNDGQPIFYIDTISNMANFRCATATNVYRYSNIRKGSYAEGMSTVFISGAQIVEKCVLYEHDNQMYTFFRFPNLQESS